MANVIEVVLRANDQMTGNMKKAQTGTQNFTSSLIKMVAMVGGIAALTMGIKKLIGLAGQQEEAEFRLAAAMKQKGVYTDQAHRHNLTYAASLQKVSRYGDEQIMIVQEMLTYFNIEGEMLDKLTAATIDLAAAKRMDLTAAADLVAKSVGSSTNALTRYGIAVEGAVGSTERMQMAIDNISKIFGGAAAAAAETYTGRLQQLKNVLGDLGETIASPALPTLTKELYLGANAAEQFGWYLEYVIDGFQRLGKEQRSVVGESWLADIFKVSPVAKIINYLKDIRTESEAAAQAVADAIEVMRTSNWAFPGMELYAEFMPPATGPSAQMLALADAIEKVKAGWTDAAMQDLAKFIAGGERMGAPAMRGEGAGMGDRGVAGFDKTGYITAHLLEIPDAVTPGLDAMDELSAKFAEVGLTAESVSGGIGAAFGNATYSMLASGQNLMDALINEWKRWAAAAIAEIFRVKIAMAALNWITGGLSSMFTGGGNIPISAPGGGPSIGMGGGGTVINNYNIPALDSKSIRDGLRHGTLGRELAKAGR